MDAKTYNRKVEALADGIVLSYAIEAQGELTGSLQEWLSRKDVVNNALSFALRNYKSLHIEADANKADLEFWKDVFWCISHNYMK
jgi:hypothetical protein